MLGCQSGWLASPTIARWSQDSLPPNRFHLPLSSCRDRAGVGENSNQSLRTGAPCSRRHGSAQSAAPLPPKHSHAAGQRGWPASLHVAVA